MPNTDSVGQAPASSGESRPSGRKLRWLRILCWAAGGLLVLLLTAAAAFVLWLRTAEKAALPAVDGDIHLAGLAAPVTVRRDAHGVLHIEAATRDDPFLAQGYVTAQDRLWQMDAFRRNANGELAEILGSSLLKHDKMQRVLQFRNTARRSTPTCPRPTGCAWTTMHEASTSSSRSIRTLFRRSSGCSSIVSGPGAAWIRSRLAW